MVIKGSIKCHLNVRFHLRPLAPISRAQQFILDEWKQDPPHPVCAPNKCFYLIWPLRHLHSFSTLCQVLFNSKPFNEDSGWNLSRQHIPTWPVSGTWMREGAEQTLSGSSGLIMLSHPKVSSLPFPLSFFLLFTYSCKRVRPFVCPRKLSVLSLLGTWQKSVLQTMGIWN